MCLSQWTKIFTLAQILSMLLIFIIKNLISDIVEKGKKAFNHNELLDCIKKSAPDISKKTLTEFLAQHELIHKLMVHM